MSYVDAYLPECVAYGFSGGPEWSTLITPKHNGREIRQRQWLYPLHRYSASFQNLDSDGRDGVLTAYYAMAGRWGVFRFRDPNNNTAVNELLTPAIGTTTPVQLIKTHQMGSQSVTQLVQAPVDGEVIVEGDGLPVAGTLDASTGLFTPDAPWAADTIFQWTGSFDIWVRFDSDFNSFSIDDLDAHNSAIDLVEVRR